MPRHYHAFPTCPDSLPLFPLTGAVLLPRGALPLNVFEPRYLEMVDYALQGDRLIGMIQPTEKRGNGAAAQTVRRWAAPASIISFRETEDNRYLITLAGPLPLPPDRRDGQHHAPGAPASATSRPSPAIWRSSRTRISRASACWRR